MRGNLKKNKGITLVALVVTIVILLIIAGVSINLVLDQNGLLTKASEGRINYINASIEEQELLNSISNAMLGYLTKNTEIETPNPDDPEDPENPNNPDNPENPEAPDPIDETINLDNVHLVIDVSNTGGKGLNASEIEVLQTYKQIMHDGPVQWLEEWQSALEAVDLSDAGGKEIRDLMAATESFLENDLKINLEEDWWKNVKEDVLNIIPFWNKTLEKYGLKARVAL